MTQKVDLTGLSKQEQSVRSKIINAGAVTLDIYRQHFADKNIGQVRDELKKLGIDPHFEVCGKSVEVLPIYYDCEGKPHYLIPLRPQGVDFKSKPVYGLAGGTCENANESPAQAAVRLMSFKYGINIGEDDLDLQGEPDVHQHTYEGNGDKCKFTAYRYVVTFEDGKPQMKLNSRYADEMGDFTSSEQLAPDKFLDSQLPFIKVMMEAYG